MFALYLQNLGRYNKGVSLSGFISGFLWPLRSPFMPPYFTEQDRIYLSFVPHLEKLYRKFRKRYPCDFTGDTQEMMSLANFLFWKAYMNWKPERGELKKRVSFVVWNGWKDKMRVKINRDRRLKRVELTEEITADHQQKEEFDGRELEGIISRDGITMLKAALRYPHVPGEHKKSLLVSFLVEIGWCGRRILDTFQEIKNMLRGD